MTTIHPCADEVAPRSANAPRRRGALSIDAVSWGTRSRRIVDGVSFEVAPGETVGLLGPNGSGKSSLMRVLAGLRPPVAGAVRIDGHDISALARRDLARRVAVVEQEVTSHLDLRVSDVIGLGRVPHRAPWAPASSADVAAVRAAAELTEMVERLPQRYSTLSGGERQRVQIARALAQEPDVLLLDEPTNHLDVRHQLALLALVRRMPVTSVVALHDLQLAAGHCDRLVVMEAGRVVAAGNPHEVLTRELIADVYAVEAEVDLRGEKVGVRLLRAL